MTKRGKKKIQDIDVDHPDISPDTFAAVHSGLKPVVDPHADVEERPTERPAIDVVLSNTPPETLTEHSETNAKNVKPSQGRRSGSKQPTTTSREQADADNFELQAQITNLSAQYDSICNRYDIIRNELISVKQMLDSKQVEPSPAPHIGTRPAARQSRTKPKEKSVRFPPAVFALLSELESALDISGNAVIVRAIEVLYEQERRAGRVPRVT